MTLMRKNRNLSLSKLKKYKVVRTYFQNKSLTVSYLIGKNIWTWFTNYFQTKSSLKFHRLLASDLCWKTKISLFWLIFMKTPINLVYSRRHTEGHGKHLKDYSVVCIKLFDRKHTFWFNPLTDWTSYKSFLKFMWKKYIRITHLHANEDEKGDFMTISLLLNQM